jgi:hypothetical protein
LYRESYDILVKMWQVGTKLLTLFSAASDRSPAAPSNEKCDFAGECGCNGLGDICPKWVVEVRGNKKGTKVKDDGRIFPTNDKSLVTAANITWPHVPWWVVVTLIAPDDESCKNPKILYIFLGKKCLTVGIWAYGL